MAVEKNLTAKELAELRKLVEYADQIKSEMEHKAAWRLVRKSVRTLILGGAAIIIATTLLWEKLSGLIQWVFR